MADYNSSLPIRTEQDGDVASKIVGSSTNVADVTIDGAVKTSDGTTQALLVDGTQVTQIKDSNGYTMEVTQNGEIKTLSKITDATGANTLNVNPDGSIDASFAPGTKVQITDGTDDAQVDNAGRLLTSDEDAQQTLANIYGRQTDGNQLTKITDGTEVVDIVTNIDTSLNEMQVYDTNVMTAVTDVSDNLVNINTRQIDGSQQTKITDGTDVAEIVPNIVSGLNELLVHDGDALAEIENVADAVNNVNSVQTNGTQKTQLVDGAGDILGVNTDGSINVNVVDAVQGSEVHVYGTTTSGVPNTPTTVVDYTVTTGKTLQLKAIQGACSGKAKVEVKTGPALTLVTQAVAFISTSSGFVELLFPQPIEVVAGDKVQVIITNRDNSNADLYAFINGNEL